VVGDFFGSFGRPRFPPELVAAERAGFHCLTHVVPRQALRGIIGRIRIIKVCEVIALASKWHRASFARGDPSRFEIACLSPRAHALRLGNLVTSQSTTSTMLQTSSSVLIVGAGTWGCSIALELARRGYTSVRVFDGNSFPSSISAGNDLNKIAEEVRN
jgi:NADPH-dependent 2,4-dienoyl-CoA reductase/sulfur reductase-like enzyme